jgi:hypothetical protein
MGTVMGAVSFELRLTGITFSNVEPLSMKYRRWVVPGCYGAAREERLANWSAGGRVPDVREVDFTAGATGGATSADARVFGRPCSTGRADVQNAGWALSSATARRNPGNNLLAIPSRPLRKGFD